MIFISFLLSIVVDFLAAKIVGYTYTCMTDEVKTSTYLLTVNARILH